MDINNTVLINAINCSDLDCFRHLIDNDMIDYDKLYNEYQSLLIDIIYYQNMDDNAYNLFALALIATGKSKPEYIDDNGNTALIWACRNDMTDVAIALIATGQSLPEHVNNAGCTALLCACRNEMTDVALAIIATGQSNAEHVNNLGFTALTYAICNNMTAVIDALNAL